MSRTDQELEGVTLLGNQGTQYEFDYRPDVLETFENKHPENEYVVTLDCPEFTSLCPKTGQPDFGRIIINLTRSFMIMLTQSSWKSPWLRKLKRYSFKLLLSTMRCRGM